MPTERLLCVVHQALASHQENSKELPEGILQVRRETREFIHGGCLLRPGGRGVGYGSRDEGDEIGNVARECSAMGVACASNG